MGDIVCSLFLLLGTGIIWPVEEGACSHNATFDRWSTVSISSFEAPLCQRRFHHNLRQPRAPRHRSERPSSFSLGNSVSQAAIDALLEDDGVSAAVIGLILLVPACGHPLELLRPPSAAS